MKGEVQKEHRGISQVGYGGLSPPPQVTKGGAKTRRERKRKGKGKKKTGKKEKKGKKKEKDGKD